MALPVPQHDHGQHGENRRNDRCAGDDVDLVVLIPRIEFVFPGTHIENADDFAPAVPDGVVGGEIGDAENHGLAAVRSVVSEDGVVRSFVQFCSDRPGPVFLADVGGNPRIPHEDRCGAAEDGLDRVRQLEVAVQNVISRHQLSVNDPEIRSFGPEQLPEGLNPLFLLHLRQPLRFITDCRQEEERGDYGCSDHEENVQGYDIDGDFLHGVLSQNVLNNIR